MKLRPRDTANLILLLLIVNASCKKDHHSPDFPITDSVSKSPYIVYVFGSWVDTAVYWKDGVVHTISVTNTGNNLSITPSANYNSGAGVVAAGSDVYTVGYEPNDSGNYALSAQPAYWLNGAINTLPDSSGDAYPSCIFVSGNDVYIGGVTEYQADTAHVPYTTPTANYPYFGSIATLWKNGTPITLPGAGYGGELGGYAYDTHDDYVSGVYVSNNNVYVAGGSYFDNDHARYWVNGMPVDLGDGPGSTPSASNSDYPNTTSIYVSGSDVYVGGFQATSWQPVAIYWKNGAPVFLSTDSLSGSEATSVSVSGSDVYIAGYQNINNYSRAMLWKNGTPTTLTGGDTSSVATSVAVAGHDVYVSGYQWVVGGHYIATYWHNGVPVNLTDGTSNAIAWSISVQ
jgi:hypothetical protein